MESKPIPIRMDAEMISRLESARAGLGRSMTRSAIIRLAIAQFLPQIEAGRINLITNGAGHD